MKSSKLLCPVDFSADSCHVVKLGIRLAQQYDCKIEFLYVVISVSGGDIEPMLIEANKQMRELALYASQLYSLVSTNIRIGEPYEEIIKRTQEENFTSIVIGAHGKNRISQLLVGDTCEQVMRHATCPVIILRMNVLEPTDSSDLFSI